jgi:serine protease Do
MGRRWLVLLVGCIISSMVAGWAIGRGWSLYSHRSSEPPATLPLVPAPFASGPAVIGTPDVADLVERVRPSVVNITAVHEYVFPLSERGWPFGNGVLREGALGSGVIVDYDGHVVTNAHVVDQADVVQIKLANDRKFRADVIAKAENIDLAVLHIRNPPRGLPAASLGSSSALRVGDYVIAIGNPFGLGNTVTMGIVSAKDRSLGAGSYDDFIQTDAPINPGNSGGPLFNVRGQVVGINTAIARNGQGIGFAIPIDDVKRELPHLIAAANGSRRTRRPQPDGVTSKQPP